MNPFSSIAPSYPSDIAAWVGLDWADQQHVICLYDVATGQSEITRLEQKPEALQDWLSQLRQRFGGAKVAIVLEQARGAVIYGLLSLDFLVLYPVNPQSLASYRKVYAPSGAKSDPVDAVLLMEMVRNSPGRFRPWKPDDADTRSLQLLTENRRHWVNQKTAFTNQLTSLLKSYYPQALELAGDLDSRQACDFLKKWPTLEALQQARPSQIRKLYLDYGRPRGEQLEQRLEQIQPARPLTTDPAAILSSSMMVRVPCLRLFRGPAPYWPRACWRRLAQIAIASSPPSKCSNCRALLRSPSKVANSAGYIGAGPVRSSCARASTSLPTSLANGVAGPKPCING
jgi:transposase